MNKPLYDVVGIGNAIVDVLCFTEDNFLEQMKLTKGSMMLVDEAQAENLYSKMGPGRECSGGSVANSLAGLASLGARCAFIGKVKNDQLGEIFRHDMRSVGVQFDTKPASSGPATARCMIFVTPDAQRTMNTYLGACTNVMEADIEETTIQNGAITYVEGYLWDQPSTKEAIRKAMRIAGDAQRRIALTLSDTFCVERHREEFLQLVENYVDILFANESEIKSLYQTDDFDKAIARLQQSNCEIGAVTRSEHGCVIVSKGEIITVAADFVPNLVDTTGAGDLFAAGFLFGLSRGWDMESCGKLGNRCAGEIITQLGARCEQPLNRLVA